MSTFHRTDVESVRILCTEVGALCADVISDMVEQDELSKTQKWATVPGAGMRRAALKRRSLDLTRRLAEMRRRT